MKIPDDRRWLDPPDEDEVEDDFLDRADIEYEEGKDDE